MAMLAFGVLLGSATSQLAQSAGLPRSCWKSRRRRPPAEGSDRTAKPRPRPKPPNPDRCCRPPRPASRPPSHPPPKNRLPKHRDRTRAAAGIPEEETLPPVKHVFLIVLGENGYEETFGASSPAPYLAKTLPEKGELLPNYYAVTKGDLANQIALLSGQGPTAETAADCPNYTDIVPGTIAARGPGRRQRLRLPGGDRDAAGPAGRKETEVEGLRRGSGHPLRRTRKLARPLRLLPLADRPPRMRAERRRPRPARDRPENGDEDAGALLHRPQRLPRRRRTALRTGAARRPARGRSVPAAGRAGDRSLARLQGRRPDRDHLRAGAADRPDARCQLLLHRPGLPEPSRPKRPRKPPPARSNRPAAAAGSACSCSRPSSRPARSTKAATSTTTRCCSASRNCSNWNRSATRANSP